MNRNNTIDFLRTILSILVIAIHTLNIYNGEKYIIDISRIAVPCFFIISGYFIANKEKNKIKKTIKDMIIILVVSNVIYLFWAVIVDYNGLRNNFVGKMFNIKTWISFFIFNVSPFRGHLWFVSALLYCHIINFFFFNWKKKLNLHINITIATFLISIMVVLTELFPIVSNKIVDYRFYRNFLLMGLPYYLIGITFKNINVKDNNFLYVINTIIVFVLYFIEIIILEKLKPDILFEHYIGTSILSISIVMTTLSYSKILKDTNLVSKIGRYLSLDIYIIHVIVIDLIMKFFYINNIKTSSINLCLLTIVFSIVFSYIIEKIKRGIKYEDFTNRGNWNFKFRHKRFSNK